MATGSEVISPLITFIGAILAILAIALIPGKTALKEGRTERYSSWGKGAIYFLAIVLLAFAAYVIYIWAMKDARDPFTTGNLALFMILGFGLIINNVLLTKRIKSIGQENVGGGEEVVHEVEEHVEEVGETTKEQALPKKKTKPVTTSTKGSAGQKPSTPIAKKQKVTKRATVASPTKPPAPEASEELIEEKPQTSGKRCPSCDTSVGPNDTECPVCGENLML